MAFTIVFDGNLRLIDGNPLKVESPFGRPIVSSIGNLADECDRLRDALEAIESLNGTHDLTDAWKIATATLQADQR